MIRAAILDLDGLMVYSEDIAFDAWQRTLAPYGSSMSEETYRLLIGTSQRASIEHVISEMGVEASPDELDRSYWTELIDLTERGVRPMPGVHRLVAHLRSLDLKLGVASNSVTAYVRKALFQIDLLLLFDFVAGVEQVAAGKPAPDLYLRVAHKLGCPPRDCLAVEDSPSGAQAAVQAGMVCVLVPNPDLTVSGDFGAHYVFPSLTDLDLNLDRILLSAAASGGAPA
jgi:HAD superfamily hydrolase (TIGR01509 family)